MSRWRSFQKQLQQFWQRWSDYFQSLQQRPRWMKTNPNLQPVALVLLREDNTTPLQWPTAVVTITHPGKDGIVRVVTIRTPKGVFKRPITKYALYRVKVMSHSVSVSWCWQYVHTGNICVFIHIN
jgi:hypothetical protein